MNNLLIIQSCVLEVVSLCVESRASKKKNTFRVFREISSLELRGLV
jgi:hypothetical protein